MYSTIKSSEGERTRVQRENLAKIRDLGTTSLSLGEFCYLAEKGRCTDGSSYVYEHKDYLLRKPDIEPLESHMPLRT